MNDDIAIALICDQNFLLPTLGTALAARAHTVNPKVRIFVYLTGFGPDAEHRALVEALSSEALSRGVELSHAPLDALASIDVETYNQTHVPVTTMARLWLHELLPSDVGKFLYLDGDVDITGRLDPLLGLQVPRGGLLAAPDLPMLIDGDRGAAAVATRSYVHALGMQKSADYFNCGVMLIDRAGWADLAADSWSYFNAHPERCRYHDQSALNAVAGSRRGLLSLYWNYQTDFMSATDPRDWGVSPTIWHFTQSPKPWQAAAFPWGTAFGDSYTRGLSVFAAAGLAPPQQPDAATFADRVRHRNTLKQRLTWTYPWRRIKRTQRIRAHFAETAAQIPAGESGSEAAETSLDCAKRVDGTHTLKARSAT